MWLSSPKGNKRKILAAHNAPCVGTQRYRSGRNYRALQEVIKDGDSHLERTLVWLKETWLSLSKGFFKVVGCEEEHKHHSKKAQEVPHQHEVYSVYILSVTMGILFNLLL